MQPIRTGAASLLATLDEQRKLSDQLTRRLRGAMKEIYYPTLPLTQIHCGDIGSYARGTNSDPVADLDIIFLTVPRSATDGYTDWTGTGGVPDLTRLEAVQERDPPLARAIAATVRTLEDDLGKATFHFVRSWHGFAGVVYNLSLAITPYGPFNLDITLCHLDQDDGFDHAQRFAHYFARLKRECGATEATRLVQDIRLVKRLVKQIAPQGTGGVDKAYKVPGFVIEALFGHVSPPLSRQAVLSGILSHQWEHGEAPHFEVRQHYRFPLIDTNHSLSSLLTSLAREGAITRGGWLTLSRAARRLQAECFSYCL